jgi:hypothetical protein
VCCHHSSNPSADKTNKNITESNKIKREEVVRERGILRSERMFNIVNVKFPLSLSLTHSPRKCNLLMLMPIEYKSAASAACEIEMKMKFKGGMKSRSIEHRL